MTTTPEGPEEKTRLELVGWFGLEPNEVNDVHTIDNDGDMFEVAIMPESEDLYPPAVHLTIGEGTDLGTAIRLLRKITSRLEGYFPVWEKRQGRDTPEAWSEILSCLDSLD